MKHSIMKDHEGDIKKYIRSSEAWYASAYKDEEHQDEVMFGFYSPDGGTSGEMSMRWHEIDDRLIPRLECFCDAWHALAQFSDVISAMAEFEDDDVTPEQFCQMLERCGFIDGTRRKREDGKSATVIADLRPGAIFVTEDGVYAVKSEYYHDNIDLVADSEGVNRTCQCVLLSSGEYAWFKNGNATVVYEVVLPRQGE